VVVLHFKSKSCFKRYKSDNADEATGIQIISRAVESPLRTIVENAGLEGSVVAKVAEGKGDFGYNAKTDEYVDMLKAGIIDPKK
jgi:chaperonin GroEL